ncbi:MAG: polyribonucleotide nucleotidyltransferase, partial [Candidatus Omnitrophica bacterium]|nr:polyribonucleotide nucleotidyltransferase [Candidatus Omnitrophota bacterium]
STCVSDEAKEEIDFVPLTVEYQEKTYAAGKIPAGFFKREGRPSENEILTARLIDRSIRPLLPKGLLNEVQIMAIVLSSDSENDPDILAVNGASLALLISDIPFNGPVASCRVARVNNEFILNPTYLERESADLELTVAMSYKGIVMLETKAKQIDEEVYLSALEFAQKPLKEILDFQKEFQVRYGKKKRNNCVYMKEAQELKDEIKELKDKILEIYKLETKEAQKEARTSLIKELENRFSSVTSFTKKEIKFTFEEVEKELLRSKILEENVRLDGRDFTALRPITCAVSVLPRTHGSSLFIRGQTQSLCVTTLGTGEDKQLIEALEGEKYKSFMLHYSFPPFSVGEVGGIRGPGRREIGHGALAEKALSLSLIH